MSLQLSVSVRNARLDQIEATIGTAPKLYIFSGAVPANCAAADPSGTLAIITLPSDWMASASSGSKALSGTWSGTGSAGGTAASFRIKDNGAVTTHMQGSVTATGGGGDMTLDNTSIANGQTITVTTFTLTDGNA